MHSVSLKHCIMSITNEDIIIKNKTPFTHMPPRSTPTINILVKTSKEVRLTQIFFL